jgi:hypothetical protein
MAWYAKIQNDMVSEVTYVIDNLDSEWLYREYGGTWLKCDENGAIRDLFPTVGFIYDKESDAFRPQQPFASWTYDKEKKYWVSPVAYPNDGKLYSWDETTKNWIEGA